MQVAEIFSVGRCRGGDDWSHDGGGYGYHDYGRHNYYRSGDRHDGYRSGHRYDGGLLGIRIRL
jgi:hypothetical protein